MKKIVSIIAGCMFFSFAFAQDMTIADSAPAPKNPKIVNGILKTPNRAADHFLIQLSSDHWSGMPDSISSHQSGFSKGFNVYFMLDKQFKTSPKYSIAIGAGVSTSNISFKGMDINLKSNAAMLPFTGVDSTNHFKKYKFATTYLEIPLEFRYTAKPNEPNKSFKAAIGLKAGTLINAHTKGKNLVDKNNNAVNSYIQKENSKRFINGTRFMGTARVGYGIFSLFGSYQFNNVLKDAMGPNMKLYQIGLTISGL